MTAVKELSAYDFNDRLLPIFQHVHDNYKIRKDYLVPGIFNPDGFFDQWQQLMELGIAKAWEIPNAAVLGAMVSTNVFTGEKVTMVVFWDSSGNTKEAVKLLDACEKFSRESGCSQLYLSALNNDRSEVMQRFCRRKGFKNSETVFTKLL